jgi:hypothetical protein
MHGLALVVAGLVFSAIWLVLLELTGFNPSVVSLGLVPVLALNSRAKGAVHR